MVLFEIFKLNAISFLSNDLIRFLLNSTEGDILMFGIMLNLKEILFHLCI